MKTFKQFMDAPKANNQYFNGRILIIGFGSVGQAIFPLMLERITISKNITVLEKDNNKDRFDVINKNHNATYIRKEIVRTNLVSTLSSLVGNGDFVIDVSVNIGAEEIMQWCGDNNVKYINTSLERWGNEQDETRPKLSDRTLYSEHKHVRKVMSKYTDTATCIVTHGANPGLVTHLTKRALIELAATRNIKFTKPVDKNDWATLMQSLGVKVVHVAERDTQIIDKPKVMNEFTNTWSCEGFWAEGRAPAEMGWGTHEDKRPVDGEVQGNAAYLNQPGVSVLMKSWVPLGGSYNGFCIQHSEAVTISEYFETDDGSFRPSVYYVYQPSDCAISSVHEMRGRELKLPIKTRIVKDEIVSGIDELGVLLIGDDFAMWHGSQLSIDESRVLIPNESATSLQVVASMLGAIIWAIKNPNKGYTEPEAIPYEEILSIADPYLGNIPFEHTDWRPERDKNSLFYREINKKNLCSFENFRVWE